MNWWYVAIIVTAVVGTVAFQEWRQAQRFRRYREDFEQFTKENTK